MRSRTGTLVAFVTGLLLAGGAVLAQSSASYVLEEHTFNAGGNPADSVIASSLSFRITLDSIGGGPSGAGLSSASHRVDAGFTAVYPPPGEVHNLLFLSRVELAWDGEPSIGSYALYRGLISELPALSYGGCAQAPLNTPNATDADPVPAGDGFFVLVTARNLLAEEGSKGTRSDGTPRANPAACP